MKKLPILTLLATLLIVVCSSCISDAISTSASDQPTFSRDTVNFDTIFTDLGTPTARLIVYNRGKKGINISSIRLRDDNSCFSLNVDGVSGDIFHDVEIRGNDSIFVFIECLLPETASREPQLYEDFLDFETNGVRTSVCLEAYGQNVRRMHAERITGDVTLTAELPVVVFDSLVVERGATLRIEPDARILFHDGASLIVHGRLEAAGEPGKMIRLRGDRLDNVLPNVGYEILAGQWEGVRFTADSYDNRMEYVDLHSTVRGVVADSCADLSRTKLTLLNSWLHNSQNSVLDVRYGRVDAGGCCFSEAADAVVSLTGGEHRFLQCTIANNYLFSAIRNPLLTLYHLMPEDSYDSDMPLMRASFENCIIYGLAGDLNEGDLTGTDVYLRNVSLKSPGEDDANFIDCLWDTDPLFLTNRSEYYFNYRLQPDSPVIGRGNGSYLTPAVMTDMDGESRDTSAPTLGAYAGRRGL